jgi:hypothetical protein
MVSHPIHFFRFAGDFSHLASFFFLLRALYQGRNAKGAAPSLKRSLCGRPARLLTSVPRPLPPPPRPRPAQASRSRRRSCT